MAELKINEGGEEVAAALPFTSTDKHKMRISLFREFLRVKDVLTLPSALDYIVKWAEEKGMDGTVISTFVSGLKGALVEDEFYDPPEAGTEKRGRRRRRDA